MAKSEYLQREEAAKKQLGTKGVKKRVKQLPTAARAFTREMTGVDISRKGVSVDPLSLAMALPVGKVLKAANVLRAAGKAARAVPLANRLVAKSLGKDAGRLIAQNKGATNSFIRENVIGNAKKVRNLSAESVFPRAPKKGSLGDLEFLPGMTKTQAAAKMLNTEAKAAWRAKTTVTRGVGTVNPEGYAALQKKPDFLGKGAFNVANKNPKRSRRGGR